MSMEMTAWSALSNAMFARDDRRPFSRATVRRVLAFARPHRRRIVAFVLVGVVEAELTVATPLLAGFLSRELIGRIAKTLGVDDAELRATLVASQMAGLLLTRYVLRIAPIATASVDELVGRIGPNVQRYLFG